MKHDYKLLFTAVAAASVIGLPLMGRASVLSQAQITSIVKDVKTIDPGKGARPAALKETLQGEQAVRTGIESRSELLFNDQTITRLGANTHFSFSEGTRNMSLDSGVMLLQVPKGAGGAKIETAAVSAAVTGTTIMVEAGKDYTKLIVLEGECCLWPRNKKIEQSALQSKLYRMHHEVCAEAGQEIILRNGSKEVPAPVYVNLKILENTALLLNGNWGAQLNTTPINAAANGQGPNDYNPTNLAIVGAGTDVVVIQQLAPPGSPPNPGTPPPGGGGSTPPFVPPGKYGPLITITSANPYTIGAGSAINTDPRITTNGVTDYGRVYRGTTLTLDGSPTSFFFGSGAADDGFNDDFSNLHGQSFPDYGIAAFKFVNLILSGVPTLDMSGNGANDLVLVSEGSIDINANGVLDFTPLNDLVLATTGGSIDLEASATIQGLTGFLSLHNQGAGNNIELDGEVNLPYAGFFASTDGTFGGAGVITAQNIGIKSAGGALELDEYQDSDVGTTTDVVNGVQVAYSDNDTTTTLSSLTLTGDGITVPYGFTATAPYSEGSVYVDLTLNSFASGTAPGNIFLSGNFQVDSLNATADGDITTDTSSSIYSNYEVDLTSNNGNITTGTGASITSSYDQINLTAYNGGITASPYSSFNAPGQISFYADSGNIFMGMGSSIYGDSGNGVTLQASGAVTLDTSVSINASSDIDFTANGGDISIGDSSTITSNGGGINFIASGTVSTGTGASFSAYNDVDFTANGGDITIGGSTSVTSNNGAINFIASGAISTAVGSTFSSSGTITFTANGGDVTMNGNVTEASDFIASGDDVTIGSTSSIITDNSIQLTGNGENGFMDVEGSLIADNSIQLTGNGEDGFVDVEGSLTTDNFVQIAANGLITINGSISLNPGGGDGGTQTPVYDTDYYTFYPYSDYDSQYVIQLNGEGVSGTGSIALNNNNGASSVTIGGTAITGGTLTPYTSVNTGNFVLLTSSGTDGITVSGSIVLANEQGNISSSGSNLVVSSGASINTGNFVQLTASGAGGITVNGSIIVDNTDGTVTSSFTNVTLADGVSINTGNFVQLSSIGGGDITVNGSIIVIDTDQSVTASSSNVTLGNGASVNTGNFIWLNAPGASVITGSASSLNASTVQITAGNNIEIEGSVGDGANPALLFTADTTGGGSPQLGGYVDFFSSGTTGSINADTIKVSSRGDLSLSFDGLLNGVQVNPGYNLLELDLLGATIEFPSGYILDGPPDPSFKLSAIATAGNVTIDDSIAIGDQNNPGEFDAKATGSGGQIVINGAETTISAAVISLAADRIINNSGIGGAVLTTVGPAATSVSLAVGSDVYGVLSQNSDDRTSFAFVQTDINNNAIASGTIPFTVTSSTSAVSVSAGSLTVGIINGSSFGAFSLNLASATDIDAESGGTIIGATSVGLQVGVTANIVGASESDAIYYNEGQLVIDTPVLSAFSVSAPAITLTNEDDTEFPSLSGSLTLASGAGGIEVNTTLDNGGAVNFSSTGGDIDVNDPLTAASITFSATSANINTEDLMTGGSVLLSATDGSGGHITVAGSVNATGGFTAAAGGDINVDGQLSAGSILMSSLAGSISTDSLTATTGPINLTAAASVTVDDDINTPGDLTVTAGSGINLYGDLGTNADTSVPIGGDVNLTASGGDIDVTTGGVVLVSGSFNLTASNGNITLGNSEVGTYFSIGSGITLSAADSIYLTSDVYLDGPLNITAGADITVTGESATFYGATDVTLALTGTGAILSESSDSTMLNFGGATDSVDDMLGIDLSGSTVTSITASGTSITLSGAFNVPVPLTLNATNGTLSIIGEGTVHASSFTGNSTNGDIAIGEPLVLVDDFNATATSGTININAPVSAVNFNANTSDGDIVTTGSLSLSGNFSGSATIGNVTIGGQVKLTGENSFTAVSSDGNVTVNAPVTGASSFYAGASYGNVAVNSTVTVTDSVVLEASTADDFEAPFTTGTANTGNITIDGSISAPGSFGATASNVISGTGKVASNNITLEQGGPAVMSQTGSGDQFTFGGIAFTLNGTEPLPSLTLYAGPLEFTSAVTLPGTLLTLLGQVNAEGNTISALGVTLAGVQTVTGAGGNATNLTVSGQFLTFNTGGNGVTGGAHLDGAVGTSGSGGTLTATSLGTIIDVLGSVSADGGSAGGNGGTLNLTAQNGLNLSTSLSTLSANGGSGGGSGGIINLTAIQGNIDFDGGEGGSGSASVNGGFGSGNGGTINFTADQGDIDMDASLFANGGDASSVSKAGGNGGTVNLTATTGNINVSGNISATSGINGTSTFPGGAGGAVNLVAQGSVNVYSTIQVSSSDLVANRVSASPGNISVTSHQTAGTAINIASSAQLLSILNQAAVGPGGKITFTADSGGDIVVSGSVRADNGTISVNNTYSGTMGTGNVTIAGATLSANVVQAQVLSPNGTLTVGSLSTTTNISADTAIKLYAMGDNGSVDFAGNTYLSGNSIKSIAGQTVTVNNNVFVNVTGGAATVYTTTPNYTGSGGNSTTTGHFTGNTNTTTQPFANRPGY